jgi:hypothetical protein
MSSLHATLSRTVRIARAGDSEPVSRAYPREFREWAIALVRSGKEVKQTPDPFNDAVIGTNPYLADWVIHYRGIGSC